MEQIKDELKGDKNLSNDYLNRMYLILKKKYPNRTITRQGNLGFTIGKSK
jgi:hypothetical protein